MAVTEFSIWITFEFIERLEPTMVELMRRGFRVGPLSGENRLTMVGAKAVLCALGSHVSCPEKDKAEVAVKPVVWATNQVREALAEMKASYHSVVVQQTGGSSSWLGPEYFKENPDDTQLERIDKAIGETPR